MRKSTVLLLTLLLCIPGLVMAGSNGKITGRVTDGETGQPLHAYDLATIKRHLRSFVWRFFKISQFKRSCVPNAPKVGSGGSLSPRGDWRAPSDAEATVWLADLERVPDQ